MLHIYLSCECWNMTKCAVKWMSRLIHIWVKGIIWTFINFSYFLSTNYFLDSRYRWILDDFFVSRNNIFSKNVWFSEYQQKQVTCIINHTWDILSKILFCICDTLAIKSKLLLFWALLLKNKSGMFLENISLNIHFRYRHVQCVQEKFDAPKEVWAFSSVFSFKRHI